MLQKIITPAFIFILFAILFAAYKYNFVSGTWRYRITVEIETPEGIKTGSAVREVSNSASRSRAFALPESTNSARVKGEAVVVDLGERGVLFALISHKSDLEFYDSFYVPTGHGGATLEGIKYYASLPAGTNRVLEPNVPAGYPKLVTFTDMNDPKSVTLVQEWTRTDAGGWQLQADHFEKLFGAGVKLKAITLEITDEPITWGEVDKWLPQEARHLNFADHYFGWPNTIVN